MQVRIASPHIDATTVKEVSKVLRSGRWAQSAKVKEFEKEFAEYIGVKHAVAVSNGTMALHVALLAAGVGPGDEVITTPFSFIASSNAILMCGAKPVYVDIDPYTFNINPELIEDAITDRTKAVMPVHLYGNPVGVDKIRALCSRHELRLVEDACQAHGAECRSKRAGSFGDAGCFSFYATKNLACGEGGMIVTSDEELARKARLLRSHGEVRRYSSIMLGYNYRMTEVAAVIGIGNLKYLGGWNKKRIENAAMLNNSFNGLAGLVTPTVDTECKHVFHQYTVRITDRFPLARDELVGKLAEAGVETKVFYPIPLSRMPHIAEVTGEVLCPMAESAASQVLSLPVHPALTKKELGVVIKSMKEVLE